MISQGQRKRSITNVNTGNLLLHYNAPQLLSVNRAAGHIALARLAAGQSDDLRGDRFHDALVLGDIVVPVVNVGDAVLRLDGSSSDPCSRARNPARDRRPIGAAQIVRRCVWQVANDPLHGATEFIGADPREHRAPVPSPISSWTDAGNHTR